MRFAFTPSTPRRRPSLTPMIDVVFLLLVFFMLAARFGQDAETALRSAPQGAGDWTGPPRLIEVEADALRLNGQPIAPEALPSAVRELLSDAADPILIRPDAAADTQRLLDVLVPLQAAGLSNLILVAP